MSTNTPFIIAELPPNDKSPDLIDPRFTDVLGVIREIRLSHVTPGPYLPPPMISSIDRAARTLLKPGIRCPACGTLMFRDDCDRSSHGIGCECKTGYYYCHATDCHIRYRSLNLAPWESDPVGQVLRMIRRSNDSELRLAGIDTEAL